MRSASLILSATIAAFCVTLDVWQVGGAPVANGNSTIVKPSVTKEVKNGSNLQQQSEIKSSKDEPTSVQTGVVAGRPASAVHSPRASVPSETDQSAAARQPAVVDSAHSLLYDDVRTEDQPGVSYDDIDLLLNDPSALARAYGQPDDVTEDDVALEQMLEDGSRQRRTSVNDVDLSPAAMAEYLLTTGDFRGLQQVIADLVSAGMLTEYEAEKYRDAVEEEYLAMIEQDNMSRQQRDVYRLQDRVEPDLSGPGDYVEYDTNSDESVLIPTDTDVNQFYPADLVGLSSPRIDGRFLEELLQSRQDYNDDSSLQNELIEAASAAADRNAPVSIDDVTTEDSQLSLEAELESLPGESTSHDDEDAHRKTEEAVADNEERELQNVVNPAASGAQRGDEENSQESH